MSFTETFGLGDDDDDSDADDTKADVETESNVSTSSDTQSHRGTQIQKKLPKPSLQVPLEVDEKEFFTDENGNPTLVDHADLEAAVDNDIKSHIQEQDRYWLEKPYSFAVIYRDTKQNEYRYIVVEPRVSETEQQIIEFIKTKLRTNMDYEKLPIGADIGRRTQIIKEEVVNLLKRYNYIDPEDRIDTSTFAGRTKLLLYKVVYNYFVKSVATGGDKLADKFSLSSDDMEDGEGLTENVDFETREFTDVNESVRLAYDQVERILYYVVRDFVAYGKIDPLKSDVQVEDISCNGYYQPVFIYHGDMGQQVVTNIMYNKEDLDRFVKTLAQNAGKGISRRQPDIDATLRDGSRAQLTLGTEISDKGSNFTIRQQADVPFTPIDLLNWKTFGIEQLAYYWLAIEHNKSLIFAGGTASGKTTSLNALSLFMPAKDKIVSIEDTRELQIPQRNWLASMTRDSFSEDTGGEIDEFDLLENALRQRPDYVVMGEVRGEEGRTMFQILNTGHTTYTTFHANSPEEVVRRFTTDPINVSKSLFEALDIIGIQEKIQIEGGSARRNMTTVEIESYSSQDDSFITSEIFTWDRDNDRQVRRGESDLLDEIRKESGMTEAEMDKEMRRRKIVLGYLAKSGINKYSNVAAVLQAYMRSQKAVMHLIATDELSGKVKMLQEMETIDIDIDAELEELTPRPTLPYDVSDRIDELLEGSTDLLRRYKNIDSSLSGTIQDLVEQEKEKEMDADEVVTQLTGDDPTPLPNDTKASDLTSSEEYKEMENAVDELFNTMDEKDTSPLTSSRMKEEATFPAETESQTQPQQKRGTKQETQSTDSDMGVNTDTSTNETDDTLTTEGDGEPAIDGADIDDLINTDSDLSESSDAVNNGDNSAAPNTPGAEENDDDPFVLSPDDTDDTEEDDR